MYFNDEQITEAIPWTALIDALDDIFTRDVQSPVRPLTR